MLEIKDDPLLTGQELITLNSAIGYWACKVKQKNCYQCAENCPVATLLKTGAKAYHEAVVKWMMGKCDKHPIKWEDVFMTGILPNSFGYGKGLSEGDEQMYYWHRKDCPQCMAEFIGEKWGEVMRIVKDKAQLVIIEKPGRRMRRYNIEDTLLVDTLWSDERAKILLELTQEDWDDIETGFYNYERPDVTPENPMPEEFPTFYEYLKWMFALSISFKASGLSHEQYLELLKEFIKCQ